MHRMTLSVDLPPDMTAALESAAASAGRSPAEEAAFRLAASLAAGSNSGEAVAGPIDWSGDPLAEGFLKKAELLRRHPNGLPPGTPDPFEDALRASGGVAPDRAAA